MLIDFKLMEKLVNSIEKFLDRDKLTVPEKQLVLGQVQARLNAQVEKQKMTDAVHNIPVGGLLKRIIKKGNNDNVEDLP